jgi:hypothetical protein
MEPAAEKLSAETQAAVKRLKMPEMTAAIHFLFITFPPPLFIGTFPLPMNAAGDPVMFDRGSYFNEEKVADCRIEAFFPD